MDHCSHSGVCVLFWFTGWVGIFFFFCCQYDFCNSGADDKLSAIVFCCIIVQKWHLVIFMFCLSFHCSETWSSQQSDNNIWWATARVKNEKECTYLNVHSWGRQTFKLWFPLLYLGSFRTRVVWQYFPLCGDFLFSESKKTSWYKTILPPYYFFYLDILTFCALKNKIQNLKSKSKSYYITHKYQVVCHFKC